MITTVTMKFPIVMVTFVNVPAGNNKRDTLKEKINEGTAESETELMNLRSQNMVAEYA